jgi:multidrug efflux pump subunit AcrA (membrane-fusion protein)|nr:MAG TPA: hypothetical protein [Caudoviricetes sp.]
MTILRKQRRIDGKKQNYYWDTALCCEVPAPARKQHKPRSDAGTARVWHLGMPVELADSDTPVLDRLRGLQPLLTSTVHALDAAAIQDKQRELYSRIDAIQGLDAVQRGMLLSVAQDLMSLNIRYCPVAWEDFLCCAERAVSRAEQGLQYLVEVMSIRSILQEQERAEALRTVPEVVATADIVLVHFDDSEFPF